MRLLFETDAGRISICINSHIKNRGVKDSPYNGMMLEREARVLEMLISEGLVNG